MPGTTEGAVPPRIAVLIDYRFRRVGGRLTAERAFALFLFAMEPHVRRLVLVGRLDPAQEPYPYEVPVGIELAELPFYPSLASPVRALGGLLAGWSRLWRALDGVDVVWVLGPNPAAVLLAIVGLARRRRVVLGVRQDLRSYARRRHPGRRTLRLAADVLEGVFRMLARRCPVVVVGRDLAERYRRAPALHLLHVSLVSERDVLAADPPGRRSFGRRTVTVGRLDPEKNPMLLADVLARLGEDAEPWWLEVYGDGPLRAALEQRLAEHGLEDRATLHGYVASGETLRDAYVAADAFLHVSWTEGMPQVLLEAFAARLPTVATDVGGVRALAGEAALLVPPGDPEAAATALRRIAADPDLRARLVEAGTAVARAHTTETEVAALSAFLTGNRR